MFWWEIQITKNSNCVVGKSITYLCILLGVFFREARKLGKCGQDLKNTFILSIFLLAQNQTLLCRPTVKRERMTPAHIEAQTHQGCEARFSVGSISGKRVFRSLVRYCGVYAFSVEGQQAYIVLSCSLSYPANPI